MVNKKGFIRTLEAVIAIVLILGLIVFLMPERKLEVEVPSNVREAREFIFNEILVNQTFRDCVEENSYGNCKVFCNGKLKEFLDANVPVGYNYACEICTGKKTTGCGELAKIQRIKDDVYTGAVYLHSDKTFRLFLYEK